MKIGVIGECMIELSQQGDHSKIGFGGDTLNTAVYLARLLSNTSHSVHYISALGQDPYSEMMLQAWQNEGIHTELVQQLPQKLPGLYSIVTDDKGERSFYYWRNDSAAKYWLETEKSASILEILKDFDYLYFSGISLAILSECSRQKLLEFLPHFKSNGGKVVFDNNYRPVLWRDFAEAQLAYQQILSFTDMAFLTLDDEEKLWGKETVEECVKRTQQFGVSEIVIKRGAESCLVEHGQQFEIPARKIEQVIDTTAAGDSFSAGYLSARLLGRNEMKAATLAHDVAGCVICHRGAIIPKEAFQFVIP